MSPNRLITLTYSQLRHLDEYKLLPTTQQVEIDYAVATLMKLVHSGEVPSKEYIISMCHGSGNPDITRSCYLAELSGNQWRD
jgi:hypothetical protein